jgi:hypothetical protein
MIRHGLSNQTVAPNAPWPVGQRTHIPKSSLSPGRKARETSVDHHLTQREITPIGSATALPEQLRMPTQTIPKPIYP